MLQPCPEPNQTGYVLSKLALKPAQSPTLLNICKHLSKDTGTSSKVSEVSSAYWLAKYSESLNLIPEIVGSFLRVVLKISITNITRGSAHWACIAHLTIEW